MKGVVKPQAMPTRRKPRVHCQIAGCCGGEEARGIGSIAMRITGKERDGALTLSEHLIDVDSFLGVPILEVLE